MSRRFSVQAALVAALILVPATIARAGITAVVPGTSVPRGATFTWGASGTIPAPAPGSPWNEVSAYLAPSKSGACVANPSSTFPSGETDEIDQEFRQASPFTLTHRLQAGDLGTNRACAYELDNDFNVIASAGAAFTVRLPHYALSFSAPKKVKAGHKFTLTLRGKAEVAGGTVGVFLYPSKISKCDYDYKCGFTHIHQCPRKLSTYDRVDEHDQDVDQAYFASHEKKGKLSHKVKRLFISRKGTYRFCGFFREDPQYSSGGPEGVAFAGRVIKVKKG